MHCITYIILAIIPSLLFCWAALPVDRPSQVQQWLLTFLYVANLSIPIYFAGSFGLTIGMIMAVWTWANGLKMAVWLFCMSQEERRKRPFYGTLFYWREREITNKPKNSTVDVVEPDDKQKLQKKKTSNNKLALSNALSCFLRDQLIFDVFYILITWIDGHQQSIVVFEQAIRMLLFQAPAIAVGWSMILASFALCTLFSIYLQFQLQITYSFFVLIFSIANQVIPYVGVKAKWVDTVKVYLEEANTMAPAFESPWEATSLRDYWSNRWHRFYNTCFVRLAFLPLRRLCGNVKLLRRVVPVWGVFAISGVMHEYFLYCTTGPGIYWHGGSGGWQMLFFLLQPIGIQIGDTMFRPGWPGRIFAIVWMIMLSHLFVVPYFLSNYFEVVQVPILPAIFKFLYTTPTFINNVF